jgi:hypothetical protein
MTSPGYDETSGAGQICFDNLTVAQAQAQCSANSSCKSFSFAAASVGVPMSSGGGCFKMDHVGFNPNPAYVGFTKQPPPSALRLWNDPKIPRVGNMATIQNAANSNGVLANANGTLIITDPSSVNPADGTFNVVAANNGKAGYVSFQTYANTNVYIRHSNFIGYTMSKDGGDMFNGDSSFMIVPALNNNDNMFSLQSYNYPDHYLMTNPSNPNQIVLQVPGSATANASWSGVLPLVMRV